MTEDQIAREVVDASLKIHRRLGPGLLESVYQTILVSELQKRGLVVQREVPIPLVYEGTRFEAGFRADIVVENKVIIEVKSVSDVAPVHKKQLLTYLRLSERRVGLLVNFNVEMIKDGITRVANGALER